MREIRQSGSEGGGNEQTVSPYPYAFLTSHHSKQESHGTQSMGFYFFPLLPTFLLMTLSPPFLIERRMSIRRCSPLAFLLPIN